MANFNMFTEMSDFMGQLNQNLNQQFKALKEEQQKETEQLHKRIAELEGQLATAVRKPDTKPDLKEIK